MEDPHGVTNGRCNWCGQLTNAEKQRDELLAALKKICNGYQWKGRNSAMAKMAPAISEGRKVIAKIEAK